MNRFLLCLFALLLPEAAHAHGISPAISGFYAGGMMVLLGPEDLLQWLALSAFAAIHPPRQAGWVAEALVVGFVAGCLGLPGFAPLWVNAVVLLTVGALLVAGLNVSFAALCGLAAVIGGLHGAHAGADIAALPDKLAVAAGAGITVYVFMVVLVATFVWTTQRIKPVRIIAFRAFGSWVVAIGAMLGAFRLAGH